MITFFELQIIPNIWKFYTGEAHLFGGQGVGRSEHVLGGDKIHPVTPMVHGNTYAAYAYAF